MTKFEWERQLKKGIESLPRSEQQRVTDYYNELFADKIDAGMNEMEIISEFGNPYDVANKIIVDFYNDGKYSAKADEEEYSSAESLEDDLDAFCEDDADASANAKKSKAFRNSERKTKHNNAHKNRAEEVKAHAKSPAGLITMLCVLLFFVLGACFGKWHPAWMIFLLIPVVSSLVTAIKKRDYRLFCYPVFVVFLYLVFGFTCHAWHPLWILFITIPVYYMLGSYVSKNTSDNDVEEDDDVELEEKRVGKREKSGKRDESNVKEEKKKEKRNSGGGFAKTFAGILLAIVLVCVMVFVWTMVISLFIAGIGMICAGILACISAFLSMATAFEAGMIILGGALVSLGLGFVFAFGMSGLFKPCAKMCKEFGKSISRCFSGKEEVK